MASLDVFALAERNIWTAECQNKRRLYSWSNQYGNHIAVQDHPPHSGDINDLRDVITQINQSVHENSDKWVTHFTQAFMREGVECPTVHLYENIRGIQEKVDKHNSRWDVWLSDWVCWFLSFVTGEYKMSSLPNVDIGRFTQCQSDAQAHLRRLQGDEPKAYNYSLLPCEEIPAIQEVRYNRAVRIAESEVVAKPFTLTPVQIEVVHQWDREIELEQRDPFNESEESGSEQATLFIEISIKNAHKAEFEVDEEYNEYRPTNQFVVDNESDYSLILRYEEKNGEDWVQKEVTIEKNSNPEIDIKNAKSLRNFQITERIFSQDMMHLPENQFEVIKIAELYHVIQTCHYCLENLSAADWKGRLAFTSAVLPRGSGVTLSFKEGSFDQGDLEYLEQKMSERQLQLQEVRLPQGVISEIVDDFREKFPQAQLLGLEGI